LGVADGAAGLMRRVAATAGGHLPRVARIVGAQRLPAEWSPDLSFLVLARTEQEEEPAQRLTRSDAGNIGWIASDELAEGDVVSFVPDRGEAIVHYREADRHHALFLTNRCNSYCVMCSQPPTPQDDSWLVEEAGEVVRHMRASPATLGLTGGEPLLLGASLRGLLDQIHRYHPQTTVEVLTNGRLLADPVFTRELLEGLPAPVSWLVPLYGHADFVHDFVVQRPGAFDQTIGGLLCLQEHRQPVQLRVVLIEPVLRVLPELCAFIGRNLPFVREVALMAAEPIGFALANRELCQVDLAEWSSGLEQATRILRRHGVPYLLMNTPLCALPRPLWPDVHKSISDWKNVYSAECDRCAAKDRCPGLFAWHERGWKPTTIRAIEETAT
jgi:His-Xaa-Ser system radical SAM maturase HxsC